jgi:hypothetical protein
MPPDQPQTLAEWLWYTRHHQDRIFVREKNKDGKWDSLSLSEITPEQWGKHVAKWLEEGRLPVRVLTEAEQKQNKQQVMNESKPM